MPEPHRRLQDGVRKEWRGWNWRSFTAPSTQTILWLRKAEVRKEIAPAQELHRAGLWHRQLELGLLASGQLAGGNVFSQWWLK